VYSDESVVVGVLVGQGGCLARNLKGIAVPSREMEAEGCSALSTAQINTITLLARFCHNSIKSDASPCISKIAKFLRTCQACWSFSACPTSWQAPTSCTSITSQQVQLYYNTISLHNFISELCYCGDQFYVCNVGEIKILR
jgi:hypothetical protein